MYVHTYTCVHMYRDRCMHMYLYTKQNIPFAIRKYNYTVLFIIPLISLKHALIIVVWSFSLHTNVALMQV